jgi:hypothetical protein
MERLNARNASKKTRVSRKRGRLIEIMISHKFGV